MPRVPALRVKADRLPTAADVIDRVLDKGAVIECRIDRITLGGVDLPVRVDARFVVASLDTYLQHAQPPRRSGLFGPSDAWFDELADP